MFGQLKNGDPYVTLQTPPINQTLIAFANPPTSDLLSRFPNRQANLDFFAEVIGHLSSIRFGTVTDKFIQELSNNNSATMKETKAEMLIKCMRFLKLKIYPMDSLEETADFLHILSEFFANAHNVRVKNAYADVLVDLLEPIAAVRWGSKSW